MNKNMKTHGQEVRKNITEFLRKNQVTVSPVSLRDISRELGLGLSTVYHHVRLLQNQGVISRNKGKDSQLVLSDSSSNELFDEIKRISLELEEKAKRTGKVQSETISSNGWQPTEDGKGRFRFESLTITITPSKSKGIL